MKFTWWRSGSWNTICDVCGFKFKAEHLKQRWDGLIVCPEDFEVRHPQELIRPIQDQAKLPWTRPEATDVFINPSGLAPGCTIIGSQAVPGLAIPGCFVPGRDFGIRNNLTDVEGFH